jgi:Cof subfamily protein (haloacid dehalogenase superfamily)
MTAAGSISLLVSDVDGTLVTNDKKLRPASVAAVKRLNEAGIAFTVTSSRPPIGLVQLIQALDIRLPVGGFNGGGIVKPDLSPVRRLILEPDDARRAVTIILDHGVDAWVFDNEHWYARDPAARHVAREAYTLGGVPPVVVETLSRGLDQCGKIVAVSDDPERLVRCKIALDATLGGTVSATRSQTYFLDVTPVDANKGKLIDALSELLSIPRERIATIGDGWNDMLMFRRSGLSIAMGNAAAEVQASANFVTATNEEDGFAKAVDQILLSPSSAG